MSFGLSTEHGSTRRALSSCGAGAVGGEAESLRVDQAPMEVLGQLRARHRPMLRVRAVHEEECRTLHAQVFLAAERKAALLQ